MSDNSKFWLGFWIIAGIYLSFNHYVDVVYGVNNKDCNCTRENNATEKKHETIKNITKR